MLLRKATMKRSTSPLYPALTLALAAVVFSIDTFTPFGIAIAVVYVVVVLLSANFLGPRGVLITGVACLLLTLASFVFMHWSAEEIGPTVRCLISLCAISVTTFLTYRNLQAAIDLGNQAALLDLTHDAIIVRDNDDLITYWNAGAEHEYGWSADEAIGTSATELLKTEFPDWVERVRQQFHATGRWEGELTHTKRDGNKVIVASRWSLQRDQRGRPVAAMEINNDITERKRAFERLHQAERELRQAIDTIPGMVWSASAEDGSIFFVNAQWSELDWPSGETAEHRWHAVVHPDDVARVSAEWAKSLAMGEPFEAICRMRSAAGEYRWHLVRASPLRDENGRTLRWYGINTDIEDRRRAEDALHKAQVELSHTARIMTLGELTASIAHEINQPLASVVTNGEACLRWLLRDVPNLEEVRRSVDRMIADGRRASDVVARLRALARNSDPRQDRLGINEIVDDVLSLVEWELVAQRISLRLDLDQSLPPVLGDRVQLQQVFMNLVVNAVQAMAEVRDRPRVLSISSRLQSTDADDLSLRLDVRDTGVGIDPSAVDRLFNAFQTTKADGMGLGLSICRSIVEAHGGRITAETNVDCGACFVVRLPVQKDVA